MAPAKPAPKPKKENPKTVGYFELFKYSTFREKLVLYWGIFFSIANGAIQPTYGLVIM